MDGRHRDLAARRVGGVQRIGHSGLGIGADVVANGLQLLFAGDAFLREPRAEVDDRVAFLLPDRLFFLGAVIIAVDVADVVAVIAVGQQFDEERPLALAGAGDQLLRQVVDGQNVLPVHLVRLDPEGLSAF